MLVVVSQFNLGTYDLCTLGVQILNIQPSLLPPGYWRLKLVKRKKKEKLILKLKFN